MTIPTPVTNDTIIGAPLTKPPVFQGAVTSRSNFVITVSPSPGFGDLTSTLHYVQPVSGPQAGFYFDVATNSSNSITLVDNGVTPTGLDPSNTFKVVPYWTIGQIFPTADTNVSFTPSLGTAVPQRRTLILLPNLTGTGINRAASTTLFWAPDTNNPGTGFWRTTAASTVNANGTPILPDSYFTVRNPTNSGTNLAVTIAGNVNTGAASAQLDSIGSSANDNYVSLGRPTDITVNDLGLIQSGVFLASPGTAVPQRRDQLIVISNSVGGINKAASVTYYYVTNSGTNAWRTTANSAVDAGTNVIQAAIGYIVRKASNNVPGTQFWTNNISIAP